MNYFLKLLIVLFPTSFIAFGQPPLCETINIRIDFYSYAFCEPSRSIYLSRSGITCTQYMTAFRDFDSVVSKSSLYIPLPQLDKSLFFRINQYVVDNFSKKMDGQKIGVKDEHGKTINKGHMTPVRISFTDEKNRKIWAFDYYYCDERVDKLFEMLNEFIPDEEFYIYPRCNQSGIIE